MIREPRSADGRRCKSCKTTLDTAIPRLNGVLSRHCGKECLHGIGADLSARPVEVKVESVGRPRQLDQVMGNAEGIETHIQAGALAKPHEFIPATVDEQGGRAAALCE